MQTQGSGDDAAAQVTAIEENLVAPGGVILADGSRIQPEIKVVQARPHGELDDEEKGAVDHIEANLVQPGGSTDKDGNVTKVEVKVVREPLVETPGGTLVGGADGRDRIETPTGQRIEKPATDPNAGSAGLSLPQPGASTAPAASASADGASTAPAAAATSSDLLA